MDQKRKTLIGIIIGIIIIIFIINKCEEYEAGKRLAALKRIEAQKPQFENQPCPICGGSQQMYSPVYGIISCTYCNGTGIVVVPKSQDITFTGMLGCRVCECKGWPVSLGKNSKCTTVITKWGKTCGHTFEQHNR